MSSQIPVSRADFYRDDIAAPLVLVHYGDFQCPYSGALHFAIQQMRAEFGADLCIVFRQFPLFDIHPAALNAALAAQAAGEKFWEMHDLLFQNQNALEDENLLDYAAQIGLSQDNFERDFTSQATKDAVLASVQSANSLGAHGTPTVLVNGNFHDNREGLWKADHLRAILQDAARAKA